MFSVARPGRSSVKIEDISNELSESEQKEKKDPLTTESSQIYNFFKSNLSRLSSYIYPKYVGSIMAVTIVPILMLQFLEKYSPLELALSSIQSQQGVENQSDLSSIQTVQTDLMNKVSGNDFIASGIPPD